MHRTRQFGFALLAASAAFVSGAVAQDAPKLGYDTPTAVGETEAVCTGVGADARADPRWAAYPLKIELTGEGGVFLGDALVGVEKAGKPVVAVHCGGPWVLLKLAPGAYRVSAEVEGQKVAANANVPASGQGRIVLRFQEIKGAISKEHTPAVD